MEETIDCCYYEPKINDFVNCKVEFTFKIVVDDEDF